MGIKDGTCFEHWVLNVSEKKKRNYTGKTATKTKQNIKQWVREDRILFFSHLTTSPEVGSGWKEGRSEWAKSASCVLFFFLLIKGNLANNILT